jgi:uncharacterized protein (DUF1697 family)
VRWVGLVRNVMLGREGLDRDVLLDVVREAGGREARSHLTTGNLTFDADPEELDDVVTAIEAGVAQVLGRHEIVAARSLAWLRELVDEDRFAGFDTSDWETEVAFLRHDAAPVDPQRLGDPRRTVLVEVGTREVLAARPRTGGARPHVNRLVERATGLPATSRGWSTLRRVAASGR